MRLRERLRLGPRTLIVTAVEAERAAVLGGLDRPDESSFVVLAAGVGPAAAAAATAEALARAHAHPFELVISAGIAGGFLDRAGVGATVLATRSIAADLGAESADGFLSLDELGFGSATIPVDPDVLGQLRQALPQALAGDVLTVTTATGTAERAAALHARHPAAVAEAMEGFGVATAARRVGLPFAEIRTVANAIGPRDRGSWRIEDALAALGQAVGRLRALLLA